MIALVKLVGILIAVITVVFALKPDAMKQYMTFWKKEKRIYAASAVNFVVGVIFLLAASQCKLPFVVAVVGILSLAKGVTLLVGGKKKLIAMLEWFEKQPITVLRAIAIVGVVLGILIIYAA